MLQAAADPATGPQDAPGCARKRAAIGLVLLGPLFHLSYDFADAIAARHAGAPSEAFGREHAILFLRWAILPYWSINRFFAAARHGGTGP